MPAANRAGYPRAFISGMSTDPMDAVSEAEEPEMPPKSMLARTFTSPRPPRNRPTNRELNSIKRFVMPPAFISRPIRMKKGSAMSAYAFMPEKSLCGKTWRRSGSANRKKTAAERPREYAIGTPAPMRIRRTTSRINIPFFSPTPSLPVGSGQAAASPRRALSADAMRTAAYKTAKPHPMGTLAWA